MSFYPFDDDILTLSDEAYRDVKDTFSAIDQIAEYNQQKVLNAFFENKVSETHFHETTGYGYDDRGREVLERVYADVFGCEDALVRHSFTSGTHALCVALFGLLRPGDELLSVTGKPYDTLDEIIGIRKGEGSLADFGVTYRQVDFKEDGEVDLEKIQSAIRERTRVLFIQRSKGYENARKTLSCDEIGEICKTAKAVKQDIVCVVDNCYGEFVETIEPAQKGADILVGSLIKNPGGGMAKSGAYIAGRADLIEKISYRLTSPGIGRECGASLGQNGPMIKGFFFAPHVVAQSLKTAAFCSAVYERLGFFVSPKPQETRFDIIQAIRFEDREKLIAFCQGIQAGSPIDSYVTPQPWDMPGYAEQVIMAAGTFVQGASIELSADAPIKEPYIAYLQGGLTFESGKYGVLRSVQTLKDRGLLNK